jgi:hypothetical protein
VNTAPCTNRRRSRNKSWPETEPLPALFEPETADLLPENRGPGSKSFQVPKIAGVGECERGDLNPDPTPKNKGFSGNKTAKNRHKLFPVGNRRGNGGAGRNDGESVEVALPPGA